MYNLARHFDILYTSTEEVRICCPFCGDDTNYHLYINPMKDVGHCFRCTWGGRVEQLLSFKLGIPIREVKDRERRSKKMEVPLVAYDDAIQRLRAMDGLKADEPVGLPPGYVPFLEDEEPKDRIGRKALRYLTDKRGYSRDIIIRYSLGYGTAAPILGRVVIPVGAKYWQARAIAPGAKPKYRNPSRSKGDAIFNATALRLDTVVICEGAFSAMALGRNAAAVLAKTPNRAQLDRIKMSDATHFIVALDSDAIDEAYELAEKLINSGKRATVREYAWGDPDRGEVLRDVQIGGSLGLAKLKLQRHSI